MPITSSGCALQSCILLLFSGRVLDDLPVISSIINICLLVKVGLRLCTRPCRRTSTHALILLSHPVEVRHGNPCTSVTSRHVRADLFFGFFFSLSSLPLSLVRLKHQVQSRTYGWKSLIKFALKMTPGHFNRVMNMKCCVRPCCICPVSPSLIWT